MLNESKARELWEVAQQHEEAEAPCCAFWAYRDAAKLAPAPSAERAGQRLAQMQQDPQIVASAEACRQLQEMSP